MRLLRFVRRDNSMNNAIFLLQPWKEGSLWVFDDERVGLKGEPFVENASQVIDEIVKLNKAKQDKKGRINLMFSPKPFPKSIKLDLIDVQEGGTGVTYRWKAKKLDAWLCPAFYCYFQVGKVPKELYASAV